jgi:hypothetical protein
MRFLRWGGVCCVVGLHLVMKAPVWALIQRLDFVGDSSGYHREMLIDGFVRHFSEWWLLGTRSTASWAYQSFDTANNFVNTGVTGGLATLALLIAILVTAFKLVGRARKVAARAANPTAEKRFWLLGIAIFAHAVAFMGVAYTDQFVVSWYSTLAIVSIATAGSQLETLRRRKERPLMDEARVSLGDDVSPKAADAWKGRCSSHSSVPKIDFGRLSSWTDRGMVFGNAQKCIRSLPPPVRIATI